MISIDPTKLVLNIDLKNYGYVTNDVVYIGVFGAFVAGSGYPDSSHNSSLEYGSSIYRMGRDVYHRITLDDGLGVTIRQNDTPLEDNSDPDSNYRVILKPGIFSYFDNIVSLDDPSEMQKKAAQAGETLYDSGNGNDVVRLPDYSSYSLVRWVSRTAFHAGDGNDRITGGDGNDIIHGDNGNDIISGDLGYDLLYGGDGADLIVGGYSADQMTGGLGDDRFYVDNAADKVFEAAGQGNDTVYCSASYTLAAGQHVETIATTNLGATGAINLAGNELAQKIVGNNGSNVLNGNGGNDLLYGYAGNDTLIGGTGVDQMHGGVGNDVFRVDNAADKVFEAAGQGTDTVLASVSYTLAAGQSIERLAAAQITALAAIRLTGNEFAQTISGNNGANVISGNGGSDVLFGFAGNDILNGGSGNDVLDGGAGTDRLDGGDGNDSYVLADGADVVIDTGGTVDMITSIISRSLANYATIEKLTLLGTANINGAGNGLGNTIVGNAGNNILNGGLGQDVLTGGAGNDSFRFDTALSAANVDRITDFSAPQDTIVLENAIFRGLVAGALAATAFVKNTTGLAADASDRIIYETDTGKLFYDGNGSAAGGSVHFATLSANLALGSADFQVI